MHCHSCEVLLKDVALDVKGVKPLDANYSKGELTVQFERAEQLNKIKKLIEKEGYRVIG